jgi:hypothetical protein
MPIVAPPQVEAARPRSLLGRGRALALTARRPPPEAVEAETNFFSAGNGARVQPTPFM